MENLEKFYSDADRELLALAEYLKYDLLRLKSEGNFSEMKQKNLDFINQVPNIINSYASLRYALWKHLPENDVALQGHRELVNCPYCNKMKKVKIVGETTNELFGWKLDKVKYSACNREFVNYLPNTWEERKLWNMNLIDKLTTVGEDGETNAEKMAGEMDMNATIRQLQKFINAQTKVEADIAAMKLQDEKNRKVIEELRDSFFQQKINVDRYNKNDGEA